MFDTSYVKQFEKDNVLELYPGIYNSRFNFKAARNRLNDFRLVANSSAYLGAYLEYKWLAFNLSTAIPGTELDRNIRLRYTSLNLRFGGTQFMYRPFFNSYNGLLIPERKRGREFLPFKNIQITNAGADIYYYSNGKKFSYGASDFFSKQQVKSAGSFIVAVTPMWQKIRWVNPSRELITDSNTFSLLSSQPQWVSLTGRLGCTYNFVFEKGKWSVPPTVLLGVGGLHQIYSVQKKLQPVSDVQAWINAGYNGPHYYFYFTAWWDNLRTNLFVKDLEQVNTDVSVTFGYRFKSWRKKVLGIL
ncbi:MAG: DUF4421 domain-containing protein [Chitinophagaceae bacterium]|nr:DUF4421 domain-containing protein [Chitinophagaceae bacterium]